MDMTTAEARIAVLERNCDELKEAIFQIRDALQSLVRLEEQHMETKAALTRVFVQCEKIETRMVEIEKVIPGLVELRRWVVAGMLGTLSVVGVSLIGLVVVVAR